MLCQANLTIFHTSVAAKPSGEKMGTAEKRAIGDEVGSRQGSGTTGDTGCCDQVKCTTCCMLAVLGCKLCMAADGPKEPLLHSSSLPSASCSYRDSTVGLSRLQSAAKFADIAAQC